MGLNIKNERVHALAREAALLAGTTQTGAIEVALERYLAEMGSEGARERMREQVTATLQRIHASMTDEGRGGQAGPPGLRARVRPPCATQLGRLLLVCPRHRDW